MSNDKLKKLKQGVGKWVAFYRENPHRLAIDYLGLKWLTLKHSLISRRQITKFTIYPERTLKIEYQIS